MGGMLRHTWVCCRHRHYSGYPCHMLRVRHLRRTVCPTNWKLTTAKSTRRIPLFNSSASLLPLHHHRTTASSAVLDSDIHHPYIDCLAVGATSGQEILRDLIPDTSVQSCTDMSDIAGIVKDIVTGHYAELCKTIPWLQTNVNIAYIQLILMSRLQEETTAIRENWIFRQLCEQIQKNFRPLSNLDLMETMLGLSYLGVDTRCELMHELLTEVRSRVSSCDISALAVLSKMVRNMPALDTITMRLLAQRLREILKNEAGCFSKDQVADLCTIMWKTGAFFSYRFSGEVIRILSRTIQQTGKPTNLEHISACLLFLNYSFRHKSDPSLIHATLIVDQCQRACYKNMNKMKPYNISGICSPLRWLVVSTSTKKLNLVHMFEQQAEKLLRQPHHVLRDTSNLMFGIWRFAPSDLKKKFHAAVGAQLRDEEIDVVLLTNITATLHEMGKVSTGLQCQVQKLLADHADTIFRYHTRYSKVFRFLRRYPFVDPEQKVKFSESLVSFLEKNYQTVRLADVLTMASFLLENTENVMPEPFLDMLLALIPRWSLDRLEIIAQSLNKMQCEKTRQLRLQVEDIQEALFASIREKLSNRESLTYRGLVSLTYTLVLRNKHRDPILTDELMELYGSISHEMLDENKLENIASIFKKAKYYSSTVLDNIMTYISESESILSEEKVLLVLELFGLVGYTPEDRNTLVGLAMRSFRLYEDVGMIKEGLEILRNLDLLGCLSPRQLATVFMISFLEKVDHYMACKCKTAVYGMHTSKRYYRYQALIGNHILGSPTAPSLLTLIDLERSHSRSLRFRSGDISYRSLDRPYVAINY